MTIYQAIFAGLVAYITLLALTRIMGRKVIAQMTFFDFVVAISIGTLGAQFAIDFRSSPWATLTILVTFALATMIVDYLHIKIPTFSKLVNSEPVVLVKNGELLEQNLRKMRYSIQDFKMMLRENRIPGSTPQELSDIHKRMGVKKSIS